MKKKMVREISWLSHLHLIWQLSCLFSFQDINFDYEYGFDYDKVIKERLKAANQAFEDAKNDPPKRKSVLVSFDNAVTAIELGAETEAEGRFQLSCWKWGKEKVKAFCLPYKVESIPSTPTVSSIKNGAASSAVKKSVQIAPTHENISKVPLNDTVEKEDPDRFANKIKEAIQRYDAEMGELHAAWIGS